MLPTPSAAASTISIISTVLADALSPSYRAPDRRTVFFASGSRPTHPSGSSSGTGRIHATPTGRVIAGRSFVTHWARARAGHWYGFGAPCSRCISSSAAIAILAAAIEALTELRQRMLSARARLRGAARIDLAVEEIFQRCHVRRYLKVKRTVRQEHTFKQARRGRPGPGTAYRRITRRRYDLEWTVDTAAIAYDEKSDGMYPLLSNDSRLTPTQVLETHKGQPAIEKRFEQIKTVHEIAPVFLKNPQRIEALFTLYFLALLIQALIERELRQAMQRERLKELPLYPEQRACKRPTTEQILRLFSLAERHTLLRSGRIAQVFPAELTGLQRQVLALLGVPEDAFRGSTPNQNPT